MDSVRWREVCFEGVDDDGHGSINVAESPLLKVLCMYDVVQSDFGLLNSYGIAYEMFQ